ncbi:reverse transcriptase domain-containing protein [Tanacetum coccineum]
MDKKVSTIAERQTENKRKFENTSRNNQNQQQQQQNKRQNTGTAYTAGTGEENNHNGDSKPLCAKCNYHHDGPCAPKCHKCNKFGHFLPVTVGVREMPTMLTIRGALGKARNLLALSVEFKDTSRESTSRRNNQQPRKSSMVKTRLPAQVSCGGTCWGQTQTLTSFMSTAFSSQIDITPSTLDHYYDVELADGRIIGLNTILRGCTLNLLNHPFNINLMPVELGSFDAIIGMDWLAKYQAIIVCAEKIVSKIPVVE